MVQKEFSQREFSAQTFGFVLLIIGLASLLAACSADISRFNFNDSDETTTGALPSTTPPESVYGNRSALGRPAQLDAGDSVQRDQLVPPIEPVADRGGNGTSGPYETTRPYSGGNYQAQSSTPSNQVQQPLILNTNSYSQNDQRRSQRAASRDVQANPVFVSRGDTLYGISRRHGTSVAALMQANNLSNSDIKPGQKLYLPSDASQAAAPARRQIYQQPQATAAVAPRHWTDSYTVQSGDSLYRLSRRYNVKISDLQSYNGISNPRALKPGMVLKVPGPGGDNGSFAATRSATTKVATRKVRSQPIPGSPTILNGSGADTASGPAEATQVAAANPSTTTDAAAPTPGQSVTVRPDATRQTIAGSTKLRWPVRGRIISGFGKRNDGTHNDGINVAVPLGTTIHAAEGGMVAYAGDDLDGYGNLVLIRHDNGWVTAYAHAEKLLVKRGDRIRRGDVIARAGRTGEVDQPQLHFEVRQGQKPVDPVPFMERI